MLGVRLPCRDSRVVRTGIVRCLLVVAAFYAADARFGRPVVEGAYFKANSKVVDPFLEDDTKPPADEEIPAIPAATPKPMPKPKPTAKADDAPEVLAPQVPRGIKQTAVPKIEPEPEIDMGVPVKRPMPARLPAVKEAPLGEKSGWKSTAVEPASAQDPGVGAPPGAKASGQKILGPKSESARFEADPDLEQLNEPLSKIVIEGNKTIKTEEIMKLIKTREGRVPDPRQIKEDIRTLISKRWFFNVEVKVANSKTGPVLVFKVLEKPILQKITYVGNKKYKDKVLSELTGLKVGGAYDVGANRESAHRIESHYREKGYIHVTVELEKGNSPEDREVVFKIVEGPKVVVTKISFSGNKFVEGAVLKQHVKTKKQILWLFGGKYDPATIPEDIQALKLYYHELGFFDVQVTHREGVSEDKANVHVEYVIDEGVRFKIRNIEFVGNRVISEEQLLKDMKVHKNDFYNQRFVNVDKEKIETQYGELGRIFATVDPHPKTFEEPGIVDLVYAINEDQPYRIGPIIVHINGDHPHTKESVVLRTLTFKPGELASRTKIKKSEQRLKNTQIFAGGAPGAGKAGGDPPRIHIPFPEGTAPRRPMNLARGQSDVSEISYRPDPKPYVPSTPVVPAVEEFPSIFRGQNFGDDEQPGNFGFDAPQGLLPSDPLFGDDQPPAYISPEIYVTETQTGRVMFGVGVNSNAGLVGSAVLEENNFDLFRPPTSMQDVIDGTAFRGGGQQFRLEAVPGLQLSRYLVSWTDPYFLDQNFMLGVSGSYYTRYFTSGSQNYWTETRAGGNLRMGRQFSPTLSGTLALKAENVKISSPGIPTPDTIKSVLGDNFLSTVRGSLTHDTRDSSFIPGSGHFIDLSYEQGIANFVYPKVDLAAKQYFLVKERPDGGNRNVISLSGNVGWTGNQTPFFERFYAGGFNTFRGFYFYGVSPREFGIPTGGFFQALGSAEYLYPITADNTIQVVAFSDFGTVDSTVTFDRFRVSVGGGFRLTVPMMGPVPIAIDLAVPLSRQPFDQTQVISFSFGLLR